MKKKIGSKKAWGTGEVVNPKGELKNGVWMPPSKFLAKLIREKVQLSKDARRVLGKRWSRKNEKGGPAETPEETFARVAWWIAQVDGEFGQDVKKTTLEFYRLLAGLLHLPDSPVFTGSGTPLGQLAGCFVLPIKDDMGKGGDGIFSTLRAAALIQQTGGGNGFSFSQLREEGALIASSMGRAGGPLGFLRVYNAAFGEIAQGGTRRGANMAVLRVDHPDIFEFIHAKSEEGKISNFNISVAITDKFMEAVEEDVNFDLVSPKSGEVKRTVAAKELFNEIIKFAHHNGEPGALFIDAANRTNPVPHLYELEATNPCGEQWLGPYESCCLGAVNLARHVKNGKMDWEKLARTVATATHFHDNIVSINRYVPAVPQLKEAAYNCRRIGIGIMGLADVFYELGVRYGTIEAEELAAQIMEFVRWQTMKESIRLAKERGPFPAIAGSVYDKKHFSWKAPKPLSSYSLDFGRPKLEWESIKTEIKKYGIRNAAQSVIGPCGTKGTVAEVEGYGCEPVFALAYLRHVVQEGEDFIIHYRSPLFEKALVARGLSKEVADKVFTKIEEDPTGGCQRISEVPEELRKVFAVSSDISAEEHIRIQAALQPFVDNSISKTCNFPSSATEEDVAKVYLQAWRTGCKGLTVYVTGSRQKVVLETKATADSKKEIKPMTNGETKEAPQIFTRDDGTLIGRPFKVEGATYRLQTPVGTAFVTINENDKGEPLEVFINVGKAGSDVAAMAEALGRTISTTLRFITNLSAKEKAHEIAQQLSGIGGRRSIGFGPNKIRSLPDAVSVALSSHYGFALNGNGYHQLASGESNGKAGAVMAAYGPAPSKSEVGDKFDPTPAPAGLHGLAGDICPSCGASSLVYEEGCVKCHICGHSEC